MTHDGHRRRLFFALWPGDVTRAALAGLAGECSPHPVAAANLHMTLHFLGACTAEQQQCYSKAVSAVRFEQFEIKLDYLGGLPRSHIQWLGSSAPPAALFGLVDTLGQALATCGYQLEKRPFVPHITLSRRVKKPVTKAGLAAIRWVVNDFALVESIAGEHGVRYLVQARWAGV